MVVPSPTVYEYRLSASRALRLSGLRYAECEGDARGGALAAAGHATGAAQWPAGVLMCDYLSAALGEAGLRGRRVVELGCGLGMCGVVASALVGPTGCVLLTDGDAGCVAFAAANVAANADAARDAPCATALLRWGDAAADARAAKLAPGCGGADSDSPRFDVCLGGDLIYDDTASPARIGELVATVDNLLTREQHAQFLLGFQRRSVPLARLLGAAAARGLRADVPGGGFVEDLFANRTEEFSDTWQLCLLRFVRDTPAAAEAAAARVVAAADAASADAF